MSEVVPALVLASGSPRRKAILGLLGLEFEVLPAPEHVEAPPESGEPPETFAVRTARAKADAVAEGRRSALVVGADTIVVIGGEILGKPAGPGEAAAMLRRLAGRENVVLTAVAVRGPDGIATSGIESTRVRFRGLSDPEIDAYVATGEPLDKAGAYGIQGYGAALVEGIEGCYFNVMGLPVVRLLSLLEEVGWAYEFPGRIRPLG
ncbi:MAG: Maf family protein [Gemmatimonadetes bacterium]|nr:Maf family protein [Gemmatimonadota bacterium]